MLAFFNADEIFEIAIDIERNGEEFYRSSAALASDADVKKLFEFLITQEQTHRETFENMRKDLPKKFSLPESFDPLGEAAMYLKVLADSHIFNNPEAKKKVAAGLSDINEAIDFALAFEKDSILLFSQMREITYVELGKTQVDSIINEEKKHVIQLMDVKREIEGGGGT